LLDGWTLLSTFAAYGVHALYITGGLRTLGYRCYCNSNVKLVIYNAVAPECSPFGISVRRLLLDSGTAAFQLLRNYSVPCPICFGDSKIEDLNQGWAVHYPRISILRHATGLSGTQARCFHSYVFRQLVSGWTESSI
jgi:hypothetical protein